ncbi:hypothetical protein [Chroococcidiopsis sp [FACHB-1243]]|uniref:hypothetical protein n=1 Tax=Chroococcidiopsis sp. [FACHB-1243] TaxID=2692781 RepID=UPI00321FC63F
MTYRLDPNAQPVESARPVTYQAIYRGITYFVRKTDCLLTPPAHLQDLMVAMAENPEIIKDYLQGFNHPPSLSPWFFEPVAAKNYLAQKNAMPSIYCKTVLAV